MYANILGLALLASTVSLSSFAFPTSLSTNAATPHDHSSIILRPGIHPDVDLSDVKNLKAEKSTSLYYIAPRGTPVRGASVIQLTHLYPAVVLEHSHYVTSISCSAENNTILVTFKDRLSFDTALKDWCTHRNGFLLVSYVEGCGTGTALKERSFHLVSGVSDSVKDLRIMCKMETIPIHETVHRDQEIRVHAATFEDPAGIPHPSTSTARSHVRRSSIDRRDSSSFLAGVFAVLQHHPVIYLAKKVVEQIPFDQHGSSSASFSTQQIKAFDGKYNETKDSYLLYHCPPSSSATKGSKPPKGKLKGAGSAGKGLSAENGSKKNSPGATKNFIDFLCVGCGVEINILLTANLVGTFGAGFKQADIKVEANVTATLVLGIHANFEHKATANLGSLKAPIPYASLYIEGILEIGAFVVLDIGVDYAINVDGKFAAGFVCTWTNVGASMDFVDPTKSGILGDWGLASNCRRVLEARLKLAVEVDPFVKLSLQIKAALLSRFTDKLTAQVALVERVSVKLTASVASYKDGQCPAYDPRFHAELTSVLYIATNVLGKAYKKNLHEPIYYPLFDVCLPIPGKFEGIENAGIVGGSSSENGGDTQIFPDDNPKGGLSGEGFKRQSQDSGRQLIPTAISCPDYAGRLVVWEGGFAYTQDLSLTELEDPKFGTNDDSADAQDTSLYWYSDSQTNITYETSDHSVLCASLKNLQTFGYDSLRTMEICPDGFTQLGLGPPAKTTSVDPSGDESPFIVAADQDATYYLMVCFPSTSVEDQILPKGKIYITNYTTGLPAAPAMPLATDLFDDANPDCECPFLEQKF